MVSGRLSICAVISAILLGTLVKHAYCQGEAISEKLWQFANDGLGVHDFQKYLDEQVKFEATHLNGRQLAQEVAESMGTRLKIKMDALTDMATDISNAYSRIQNTNPFDDCCTAYLDEESEILKIRVNNNKLCTTGQGLYQGEVNTFLPSDILDAIKTHYKKALGIKYAYYGSEEGIMFNYPAVRTCDRKYDPRFRPWYVEASTSEPKDIVIVVDKSGSMKESHRGRSLMSIAIEAATTVINTLNPNDRVGVVAFSTTAERPSGNADTSTCYSTQLAVASAQNKDYLNKYVSYLSAGGETQYTTALSAAFDYFSNSMDLTNTAGIDRSKVILFLTDGEPTDSEEDILNQIAQRNRAFNNSVIILTYGLGQNAGHGILQDMADQIHNSGLHGETTLRKGQYSHVEDPDKLREEMGSYYDLFKQQGVPNIIFTVPFVDSFGSGLTEALCLPVSYQGELMGVACMEISVGDMLSEITYFQEAEKAYAFIVDSYARVLTHPLFSQPQDITNNPYFTYLNSLEAVDGINHIITSNKVGNLSTTVRRIISRGDVTLEGVDTFTIGAEYSWHRIEDTGFVICLVIPDKSSKTRIVWENSYPDYLYHRLDLVRNPPQTCKQFSRVASKLRPMLFFAARAFEKPFEYLYSPESSNELDRYEIYLTGLSDDNPGFREDVRDTVAATGIFEHIIAERDSYNLYSVWRYAGMENGVHRTYPAAETPKNYDPTKRTWYLKANAHRSEVVITTPYEDAFGAGIVVTLSHVLYEGKIASDQSEPTTGPHEEEDPIIGVMGMDFTLTYFYYLVTEGAPQCETYSCFIVDNSGYIIVHKNWITQGFIGQDLGNVHITQAETGVANELIQKNFMTYKSCVNIETVNSQYSWRLVVPFRPNGMYQGNTFNISKVDNTNIFLVTVTRGSSARCHCQQNGVLDSCYSFTSYPCFCPCYKRADVYKYCDGEFEFTRDGGPQCTPPIPKVNFDDVAEKDKNAVKSLGACFDYNCLAANLQTARECNAIVSCSWCLYDSRGNTLDSPQCNKTEYCGNRRYENNDVESDNKSSTGVPAWVIGVVIGVLVVFAIIGVTVYLRLKKKRNPPEADQRLPQRPPAHLPTRTVGDGGFDNLAMKEENNANLRRGQTDGDYTHLYL